jgi:hypothetical protein
MPNSMGDPFVGPVEAPGDTAHAHPADRGKM